MLERNENLTMKTERELTELLEKLISRWEDEVVEKSMKPDTHSLHLPPRHRKPDTN